ncbi:MAG: single-stranded-DNA-specific exonuclease RecJ [bacterium]|nr:single-stranded-DNA-specific exonuclease RecJ [bacterium]
MEVSELMLALLSKRGIVDTDAITAFLNPDYEAHTHSPFLLEGMDRAVSRVLSAVTRGERIAVYADFDCDGIPGAALLADFFAKIKYRNVETYIPHRDREGYGFHEEAIKGLAERGVILIITVDVGTAAIDAVRFAKKLGVDVIVTDHHEITGALPEAVAVLNPKFTPTEASGLGAYPFRDLCGAAVAFKLVQALLQEGRRHSTPHFHDIPIGWEKWLLDLVGIATIADMVPLHGENRVLAHFGLAVLRKSPRPGIQALCNRLRLRQAGITEDDIGFSFAPRINAASRMDDPDLALQLLTTLDSGEAEQLAAKLEQLNTSRKGIVGGIVREAKRRVRERFSIEEKVVVLGDTEWKPSLLGLACNSIVEERGGIVCLWGRDAKGNLKGSCRSDGSISVVGLFSGAGDVFLEYGGHNAAGGFSVSHEQVHTLHEDLVRAANGLWKVPGIESATSNSDARASLSEVTPQLFKQVSCLAPFGVGNLKPVFLISGATISSVRKFGRSNNHIELMLSCARTGVTARAFDFFKTADSFTHTPEAGLNVDLLATVERDSYRGGLALRIVDIIPAT